MRYEDDKKKNKKNFGRDKAAAIQKGLGEMQSKQSYSESL
jgi:hypothetical protein